MRLVVCLNVVFVAVLSHDEVGTAGHNIIAEETIEQAFIESYRLLCKNNEDVLGEFISRTEEALSAGNAGKQLAKAEKDIEALEAKRAKLVDMHLEGIIDKATYEEKYFDLTEQMIVRFIKQVAGSAVIMPRVVVCIPEEITEVERMAVIDAVHSAGARKICLISV